MAFRFQYTQLNEERDWSYIRLLTLYPLNSPETINCTITRHRLSAAPIFNALSYTWGSEIDVKSICIDGRTQSVRRNLWDFLRYLCAMQTFEKGKFVVWADAVCIDQHNVVKRNQQVSMMGHIYSSADCVIAWIRVRGSPVVHLEQGLSYKLLLSIWGGRGRQHQSQSVDSWSNRDVIRLQERYHREWIVFRDLCQAEYW